MLDRYEQFSGVISGIHRRIQKLERDEMVKYGYKGAYAQYLVVLARYPEGLTATQLCDICDKDKAAVSRIAAEMEQKGLIVRQGSENGYRARLALTEEGKKAADYVCGKVQFAVREVGSALPQEQRAAFYAALQGMATILETLSREGIPGSDD